MSAGCPRCGPSGLQCEENSPAGFASAGRNHFLHVIAVERDGLTAPVQKQTLQDQEVFGSDQQVAGSGQFCTFLFCADT